MTAAVISFPKLYNLASAVPFDKPLILTCGFRFQRFTRTLQQHANTNAAPSVVLPE